MASSAPHTQLPATHPAGRPPCPLTVKGQLAVQVDVALPHFCHLARDSQLGGARRAKHPHPLPRLQPRGGVDLQAGFGGAQARSGNDSVTPSRAWCRPGCRRLTGMRVARRATVPLTAASHVSPRPPVSWTPLN